MIVLCTKIVSNSRRVRVPKCAFCYRWREIGSFESAQKSDGDTSFELPQETTEPFHEEAGKSATDPDVTRMSCDVSKTVDDASKMPVAAAKTHDDASKMPDGATKSLVDSSKTPVMPSDVSSTPDDMSSVPADPASLHAHSPAALPHDTELAKTQAPIAAITHPTDIAAVRETVPDEKTPDIVAEPSGVQQSDVDKQPPDVAVQDAADQEARQGKYAVTSTRSTTGDGGVLDVDTSDGVCAADASGDAVTLKADVGSEDDPSEDEQVIIYYDYLLCHVACIRILVLIVGFLACYVSVMKEERGKASFTLFLNLSCIDGCLMPCLSRLFDALFLLGSLMPCSFITGGGSVR